MKDLGIKYFPNLNRGEWAVRKLSEISLDLPNKTVSDIGSGYGWFGKEIKKLGLEWQPFDSEQKIKEARLWDLNDPPPQNCKSPGAIVMLEVLEHLSNPELAIRHLSEHIAKNGYIAISTPNPLSIKSKISTIFNNQLYAFQPKHLTEHHVFVPLPHVVIFFFKKHGFELQEFGTIGGARWPGLSLNLNSLKANIMFIVGKFLGHFGSTTKGDTQVFLFKKVVTS